MGDVAIPFPLRGAKQPGDNQLESIMSRRLPGLATPLANIEHDEGSPMSPSQDVRVEFRGQSTVTRADGLPGIELWQMWDVKPPMQAITGGAWIGTAGPRNRDRAWARTWYRGRVLEVSGPDITLLDPNEPVGCEASNGALDTVVMVVDTEHLAGAFPEGRPRFAHRVARDPALDALLWRAVAAIIDPLIDPLERDAAVDELIVVAHARYGEHATRLSAGSRNSVARARELVEARYCERLTLDEIATSVGISKYHLARKFRTEVGRPIHQYVTMLRVREAMRRLARDEAPSHVAAECGFADQAHLTRALRGSLGFTPAKYRQYR